MLAISGTYENGKLILNEKIKNSKPINVIVTFLDDVQIIQDDNISIKEFSFLESQNILKELKGSISDEVLTDRKLEI